VKKIRLFLIVLIAWVMFALPTQAQFICHVTAPFETGLDTGIESSFYTALGCNGNDCTAAMLSAVFYGDTGGYQIFFLHSNDGGFTWKVQNPGLPLQNGKNVAIFNIQQIDSLHVIAAGDADLVMHTSDGGATWQQQKLPTTNPIADVSFSDSLHGIIVTSDTPVAIFLTSDGGNNWIPNSFLRAGAWQCHDYGQGKYRLFTNTSGIIYTTTDNWQTVDSTNPIYLNDSGQINYSYELADCNFGAGDTMIAYGVHWTSGFANNYPLITRTTDGGAHWITVYDDTNEFITAAQVMSSINRDTIVVGFGGVDAETRDKVLLSIDRGVTWHIDTLIFTDTNFTAGYHVFFGYNAYGIALNSKGDLIGAFNWSDLFSSLIIGESTVASVNSSTSTSNNQAQIYPNPATETVTITSLEAGGTMHLLDILGREVLQAITPASGSLTLDVSSLPSGLYYISDGIARAKFVKE
jgi:photosystem II stability/assembly factor-like uncharacterized protein